MFTAEHLIDLLVMGWLSNIPLALGSVVTLAVFFDRWRTFRGLAERSKAFATEVIESLALPDLDGARRECEDSDLPIAKIFSEALRWENVAVEDYDRVLATMRAEASADLRRGIWMIGTVGSLAPFVGLFGTVVGIIRAFSDLAGGEGGGFAVVASSLSEALVATAAGLAVAIVALSFYNYLNTRVAAIAAVYARASERLVQAIIYVDAHASRAAGGAA